MNESLDGALAAVLEGMRAADQRRRRRVVEGGHGAKLVVDGRACVNFCSNDYLGLATDARVAEAAAAALKRSGTGAGAAALVSGYNAEHQALEEALATHCGRPRALLFSSGWSANIGALRALLGRADTLVADELNHASLIDGGRLSGAEYRRVDHADDAAFERALSQPRTGRTLVVTDAVFSMDGDRAPLAALSSTCRAAGATLMVDDAHGFGVLGPGGAGTPAEAGLDAHDIPVYVATLGKALGVAGAFVAGSETLIEFLLHRARSFVFSTAPPPALAAAARTALTILRDEPARRDQLQANLRHFRAATADLSFGQPPTRATPRADQDLVPIQPMHLGAESRALWLSQWLFERGYWVAAIRPPTVPRGTSRLRITLSAAHTRAQVDGLCNALSEGVGALRRLERAA